jgi:hypothetical protein
MANGYSERWVYEILSRRRGKEQTAMYGPA